ncbi:MAG: arsinothricin resistance N-acetyltransferase ArsN1 family A [Methylocystaceae bacterium]
MDEQVRNEVKKHYSDIASKIKQGGAASCGCGEGCCGRNADYARILYDQHPLHEIPEKAREASLGCANPLLVADLKPGEVVLDLGSGGGIDVFLAAREVGPEGYVYGLDMSEEMLELARMNQQEMGIPNVEFRQGYLEDIPLPDHSVDVIMSNCVINLSTDKERVMREMARVLKPGGRLAIADIIKVAPVDPALEKELALWVSCVAGTLPINEYTELLKKAGFVNISIEPMFIYNKEHLQQMVAGDSKIKDFGGLNNCYAGSLVKANHPGYTIRAAEDSDLEAITRIYNQGITDKVASLDTCPRSLENMKDWMAEHQPPYQVLVAENADGQVVGWASLNEFANRCCSQGVADLSLYVEREERKRGWGRILAAAVEAEAQKQQFHKLVASCLGSNPAPIDLALKSGYRLVGTYQNQGYIDGRWMDVILLEKILSQLTPPIIQRSSCCCG